MNTLKRSADVSVFDDSVKKSKVNVPKPPLPKDLTQQFQPLYCVLCKAQLSSPLAAAGHYSGKPHQKKVKQYLAQNHPELLLHEENPSPVNAPAKVKELCTSLTQDQASMCRICNVVFPGSVAAQSHYAGKKHRSRVLKGYTPIERVPGMDVDVDSSGRFGIGEAFRKDIPSEPDLEPSCDVKRIQKWYCDICKIQTTDDDQYRTHLAGKKHMKNCNKMNLPKPPPPLDPSDSLLKSVTSTKKKVESDFSTHRTPSGNYYCKTCDLNVNSATQFSQHVESKKHKSKSSKA